MKGAPLILLLAACATPPTPPPSEITYQIDCAEPACVERFAFTDDTRWIHKDSALELLGRSDYKPPFRSPTSIALLKELECGDFDLDVDLLQTGRNYGHRDLCLFFGFQSPQRYYYVHLATSPDQNAHNIFRVQDAARTNIAPVAENGIDWGRGEWHHVRIERRVDEGSIRVFWDRNPQPILETVDKELRWGRIGVGSFDDSGRMRNLVVRAPGGRIVKAEDPFHR